MKLEIKLIRPQKILNEFSRLAWEKTIPEVTYWISRELIPAMVYGGLGIEGIAQTPFYKFVTSDEGLSELGIEKTEPPKLLEAYAKTAFTLTPYKYQVTLQFGQLAKLKTATQHPAGGTGHLQVISWLEWVTDSLVVGKGYVPRANIPVKAQTNIRLGSPLGGLMLSQGALGSLGSWHFPIQYSNYDEKWFSENIDKIQKVLIEKSFNIFKDKLTNG